MMARATGWRNSRSGSVIRTGSLSPGLAERIGRDKPDLDRQAGPGMRRQIVIARRLRLFQVQARQRQIEFDRLVRVGFAESGSGAGSPPSRSRRRNRPLARKSRRSAARAVAPGGFAKAIVGGLSGTISIGQRPSRLPPWRRLSSLPSVSFRSIRKFCLSIAVKSSRVVVDRETRHLAAAMDLAEQHAAGGNRHGLA